MGPFIVSIIDVNKGIKFSELLSRSMCAIPSLAFVYIIGNSICSSDASRSINRSYTSSTTSFILASDLSILFITRIIGNSFSKAFFRTNLVCGRGPSLASTSKRAPSTKLRLRSTSPPKSACPGVSRILILIFS